MTLLRSHYCFCHIAKLDPKQSAFLPELIKVSESEAHSLEEDGRFSILNKTFVALFRMHGQIYLQLGAQRLTVPDIISVDWGKGQKALSRWIKIKMENSPVLNLSYDAEYRESFDFDFTAFEDDENYDFGLWITNVLNSKKRKKVFLNPSSSL